MSSKKKLQVFVSSTYLDLQNERQAAVEAILKAGHIPAGMELFSAGNESQLETIRRWIDESDVYMLILGGRYGSVDPKTALSYTELEYDYAVSKEMPIFSVVITEPALDEKLKIDGKLAIETERPQELKLFRDKVLNRISSFFQDPKDIKLAVHETLSDFMSRYSFKGWVSGAEIAESSALIEEISRLHKHNQNLEKELAELKQSAPAIKSKHSSRPGDEELQEISDILESINITTQVLAPENPPKSYSVLQILNAKRDTLVTGLANKAGMSDVQKLLYFNVMPKLEVHALSAIEKVPGVYWQRYRLTPKGMSLLAFLDKKKLSGNSKTKAITNSERPKKVAKRL